MKEKINLEESLMFGMFVFSVDRKEEKRCICLHIYGQVRDEKGS